MIYREPIVQNPRREIAIAHSLGADNRRRTRVAALRLFQDFTQRGERCLGGATAVESGSGSIWRYGE
ncbi:hypothetical protein [Microcoleus sp. MON2_D5]|uniref:hypothetical protein n=1 Tax=Microcoleus sp. MON2_D5 TaxID=2818833 RepID=UPI002FD0B722